MASMYDFERMVFMIEGIRIILRAPTDMYQFNFPEYRYERRSADNSTVGEFLGNRIYSQIPFGVEAVVVDGFGRTDIHPYTMMGTLRQSYMR